jgi:hypothetical protein
MGKADPKFLASSGVGAVFTSFNASHAPGFWVIVGIAGGDVFER